MIEERWLQFFGQFPFSLDKIEERSTLTITGAYTLSLVPFLDTTSASNTFNTLQSTQQNLSSVESTTYSSISQSSEVSSGKSSFIPIHQSTNQAMETSAMKTELSGSVSSSEYDKFSTIPITLKSTVTTSDLQGLPTVNEGQSIITEGVTEPTAASVSTDKARASSTTFLPIQDICT